MIKFVTVMLVIMYTVLSVASSQTNQNDYWTAFGNNLITYQEGIGTKVVLIRKLITQGDDFYISGRLSHIEGKYVGCIGKYVSITKQWSDLDSGVGYFPTIATPTMRDFAVMPNGDVFAGDGSYDDAGGPRGFPNYNVNIQSDFGAKFSGGAWSPYPNPARNGRLVVTQNGDLFLMHTYIYKWNGSSFQKVVSENVRCMYQDGYGQELIKTKGDFIYFRATDSLDAKQNWIKKFNTKTNEITQISLRGDNNGSTWSPNTISIDDSGNVYVGGTFTKIIDVAVSNIAKWNSATQKWSGLGLGFNGSVYSLEIGKNGELYAGGFFTQSGSTNVKNIAVWDGAKWDSLGSGVDDKVEFLEIDQSGRVYVAGAFSNAGEKASKYLARWDKPASVVSPPLIVNTIDDKFDRSCDLGHCSLRDAIYVANLKPDLDTIKFDIKNDGKPIIIVPDSSYADILYPVVINGEDADNEPSIHIEGYKTSENGKISTGLRLFGGNSTIKGLTFTSFDKAIDIVSNDNIIDNCIFGFHKNNATKLNPNNYDVYIYRGKSNRIENNFITYSQFAGIKIELSNSNLIRNNAFGADYKEEICIPNRIAVTMVSSDSNWIENNSFYGSQKANITLDNSRNNTISFNTIGLNKNGDDKPIDNQNSKHESEAGIELIESSSNFIENNDIAGNTLTGLLLNNSDKNKINKNNIGTSSDGKKAVANTNGIEIIGLSKENIVSNNLISGNKADGIFIHDVTVADYKSKTLIYGNLIGIASDGITNLPNNNGITINGSSQNEIGNLTNALNIISGNLSNGIVISGLHSINNTIRRNRIGTDSNGILPVPNKLNGILINNSSTKTIIEYNHIAGNTLSGISITSLGRTESAYTGECEIANNFIGTDAEAKKSLPNFENGITIYLATDNILHDNVLSGNGKNGVYIEGLSADKVVPLKNSIYKNKIGVDKTGSYSIENGGCGIRIEKGASECNIGLLDMTVSNIISGNRSEGIYFAGKATIKNIIINNYIGLNSAGSQKIPNSRGIAIFNGASGNIIGGDEASQANVISGNNADGIYIGEENYSTNEFCSENIVSGNIIGLDKSGTTVIGNKLSGVFLGRHSQLNTIGGNTKSGRNIVSGNGDCGIRLEGEGVTENVVKNNIIGTDSKTESKIPNNVGILIKSGARFNTVGMPGSYGANIISGNYHGVVVEDYQSNGNSIQYNFIGLNELGNQPLGNNNNGVFIKNSRQTTVSANVISGNLGNGIEISNDIPGIRGENIIQSNFIGLDITGEIAVKNNKHGIYILGSSYNHIGVAGKPNIISGNELNGIFIENNLADLISHHNFIMGNIIGTNLNSSNPIPNKTNGIRIQDSDNNTIGAVSAPNTISHNLNDGILLIGSSSNRIVANKIESNSRYGIELLDGSSFNTITNNLIRGNKRGYSEEDNLSFINSNVIAMNEVAENISNESGIHLFSGNTIIKGNLITKDKGNGITVDNGSKPIIENNNILQNEGFGVNNKNTYTISATNNWWGDPSGPSGKGSGLGDEVSDEIIYANWKNQKVGLVSLALEDTLYIPENTQDSTYLLTRNWNKTDDNITISVTDKNNVFVGAKNFTSSLTADFGGSIPVVFTMPSGIGNQLIEVKFTITSNSTGETNDVTVFIQSYKPEVVKIVVIPDSVTVGLNEKYQFYSYTYDQENKLLTNKVTWSSSSGIISDSGLFTSGLIGGKAVVTASSADGKIKGSAFVIIDEAVSVEQELEVNANDNHFLVVPNPLESEAKISLFLETSSFVEISVFNIIGTRVLSVFSGIVETGSSKIPLDMSQFSSGAYIISTEINNQHHSGKPYKSLVIKK